MVIDAIKEVIEQYRIHTDVEECSITPLHYLFARYASQDNAIPKLLQKIKKIDTGVTNIKHLVQLRKGSYDPRKIEEDSFLDGGILLLWCLKYNRPRLLQYLLDEPMVHFWRFA